MVRQPPRSPRTDTLCPYATRSRSRHDFQELYEILPDAFSVAPSISRSEAVQLFRKALIRCRRAGPLTADAMIEHAGAIHRSEEHTSELQSLMRISYAVFCLKKKKNKRRNTHPQSYDTTQLHKHTL